MASLAAWLTLMVTFIEIVITHASYALKFVVFYLANAAIFNEC